MLLSPTSATAHLLNGPTPHVVGSGTVAANSDWQAGVAIGSRVALLRGGGGGGGRSGGGGGGDARGNFAVLTIAKGCSSVASVEWATVNSGASWAGAAAALAKPAAGRSGSSSASAAETGTVFAVLAGAAGGGTAARLIAIELHFGGGLQASSKTLATLAAGSRRGDLPLC